MRKDIYLCSSDPNGASGYSRRNANSHQRTIAVSCLEQVTIKFFHWLVQSDSYRGKDALSLQSRTDATIKTAEALVFGHTKKSAKKSFVDNGTRSSSLYTCYLKSNLSDLFTKV